MWFPCVACRTLARPCVGYARGWASFLPCSCSGQLLQGLLYASLWVARTRWAFVLVKA